MVTDISKSRLIMMFTETLTKPLRGWVKSYRPTTLADAISRTRDFGIQCPKIGFFPEPISLLKIKRGNPSRKNGPRKNGWTMIPDRTLEEKSYVSLAKNHGTRSQMFREGKGLLHRGLF